MKKELTPEQLADKKKFYNSGRWNQLRKKIRQRDNNECQQCKREGKVFIDDGRLNKKGTRKKIQLIVHHIIEREDDPSLQWTESNLECLCVNCHNKIHDRYYQWKEWTIKKNKYADDEKW